MKKIAIYGIGNFGYALLSHLSNEKRENKISIYAYDRNKIVRDTLKVSRSHPFFHTSEKISEKVVIAESEKELISDCDILVLAVTSDATREVLNAIYPYLDNSITIVNTAKALDYKTGKRLSEVVRECLEGKSRDYALLAGGTIAKDIFEKQPLGVDLACENEKIAYELAHLFASPNLFIYPTNDLIGVEYASAFKNVIAILAGIIKGMGFSYGSETHIISRAAYEIEEIVVKELGGKRETFRMNSQCWGNDLWMSCTGDTRNREFGVLIGRGMFYEEALVEMRKRKKTVEGASTIRSLKFVDAIKDYPLMNFLCHLSDNKADLNSINKVIFNHQQ